MKKIIFCTLCLCAGFVGIVAQDHVPNSVALDLKKAVGEIPFTSSVSATGAMTCNVPIEVYPGIRGMQPQLALSYNHLAGMGIAGMGWSISGLSGISRTAKNIYYDNTPQSIRMNKDDAFVLDGMRLIKLSATSSQIKYETEQGNIKVNAYLNEDIIKYFEVLYPQGRKGIYGYTDNTSNKLQYPLTVMSDLMGNTVCFDYEFANNHYKITTITYMQASVELQYEDRTDKQMIFEAGQNITEDNRLKRIICRYGTCNIRTYELTYQYLQNVSVLSQIDYLVSNASLNPLIFYYGTNNITAQYAQTQTQLIEWYKFENKPEQFNVVKGKFDYGSKNDGIISFPKRDTYELYNRNGTWFRDELYHYNNLYNGSEKILVHTGLERSLIMPMSNLTTESGFVDIFCANLDGKEEDEIIKINNYVSGNSDRITFKVYAPDLSYGLYQKYTRTFDFSTLLKDEGNNKSIHPKWYFPGDFNGDGKMEIFAVSNQVKFKDTNYPSVCYLFDLESNKKLYEGQALSYFISYGEADKNYIRKNIDVYSDIILILDYDGDGKSDICHVNGNGMDIYRFNISGSNYSLEKIATNTNLKLRDLQHWEYMTAEGLQDVKKYYDVRDRILFVGEMNGDGKTDLLLSPRQNGGPTSFWWSVFYSKGNGNFEQKSYEGCNHYSNDKLCMSDINGDGLTDIIKNNANSVYLYINQKGAFSYCGHFSKYNNSIVIPTDIHSQRISRHISCLRDDGKIDMYSFSRNDTKEKLLTGIVDSYGVITQIDYQKLNDRTLGNSSDIFYHAGDGASFPYENYNGALFVPVATEKYVNGQLYASNTYKYHNAIVHKQGLGFCGFTEIDYADNNGKMQKRIYDPFHFGLLKSEESYINNTLVASSSFEHTVNVADNKITKIQLTSSNVRDHLKKTSINGSYQYDTFGYPTEEYIDYGEQITQTITKSYSHKTAESNYLLGVINDISTTHYRKGAVITERDTISISAKGLPTIKLHYINGMKTVQEKFSYDSHANLSSYSLTKFDSPTGQASQYEYDDCGRITKMTDPLGLSISYIYDPKTGRLSEKQNHHGQSIYYYYDDFGRTTTVQYPDKTEQIIQWSWDNTCGLYKMNQTATGKPAVNTYFDALGREIRNSSIRFDGTTTYMDKKYDYYGRLERVSLPYTTGDPLWNSYVYDYCDRVLEIDYVSGKTDYFKYNDNSVTSTQNGITSTQVFDPLGNVVRVEDEAGEITYQLRPDGQPESITAPGKIVTSFKYDNYGRQTAIIDPSAGVKQFAYDNDGNLLSETNANGETTIFSYDKYNRPITKKMPEFTVYYRYDADGRLAADSINADRYTRYRYNRLGQLEMETQKSNGISFEKEYTYQEGNLHTKEYSTNGKFIATENYKYSCGHLVEITLNDETVIWRLDKENNLGQPVAATTGKFSREYDYDEYGLPTARRAGNFMDFGYEFDSKTNDLLSRIDYKYMLPNKLQSGLLTESFTYDELDRLMDFGSQSVRYDEKGNITRKSDAGDFYYDNPGKPYAISAAKVTQWSSNFSGGINIVSPGNTIGTRAIGGSIVGGNITSGIIGVTPGISDKIKVDTLKAIPLRDQYIKYASFNRPVGIDEGNVSARFEYDGNGQRLQMKLSKQNNSESTNLTRIYFADCYEHDSKSGVLYTQTSSGKVSSKIMQTKERLYLGGNAYSAPAVYVKENGKDWKIYYICRDYLGSITHITDENGNMVQELSYDAWGRLRNPQTQTAYEPDKEPELFLGRGYTGHEHLPDFGLINMNARLYDPATGRFLSPDPYVQNPFFSQNFNRYSYALNNPFKYTDQSGEFIGWVLAGLILGGKWYHDGYKANNNEPNPANWDYSKANYTVGYSTQGNTVYGGMGWDGHYALMMGYNTEQGLGFGYDINNTRSHLYHPYYNYNAPEEAAVRAYNAARQQMTPWAVGWEWLTGTGERDRTFYGGDHFTTLLQQHSHIEDTRYMIVDNIMNGGQLGKRNDYGLDGWQGVGKYFVDYSTLATGGLTGNLAATYLGSYSLTYNVLSTNKNSALVQFTVTNPSHAASAMRPPVIGYGAIWQNYVAPFIDRQFSSGPMSQTTQTFIWCERIFW